MTDAADGPPTTPGDASAAEEPTATEAEDEGQTVALEAAADEAPAAMDAKEEVRTAAVDASAAEEPVAADAKGGSRAIAVKASVGPSEAGADGITFKIELSRPAEQTLVLIYGTLDGTAKAGTDYEPQQGVITLAPGTESGEVHVPLLEHQPAGGDKRFELFLMADPKFAEVVDQRIIATIHGND